MTVRAARVRTVGSSDCAVSGATSDRAPLTANRTIERTDIGKPPSEQMARRLVPTAAHAEERGALRVDLQVEHLGDVRLLQQDLLPRDQCGDRRSLCVIQVKQLLVARTVNVWVR